MTKVVSFHERCRRKLAAARIARRTSGGTKRRIPVKPSMIVLKTSWMRSKTRAPCCVSQLTTVSTSLPKGNLCDVIQSSITSSLTSTGRGPAVPGLYERQSSRSSEAQALLHGVGAGLSVECGDAGEPLVENRRVLLQPLLRRRRRIHAVEEDRAHHLVFHLQLEDEVLEELADIRAVAGIAGARVGEDRGAAVVGAEDIIATGEIFHVEFRVHRMGFPAEEDDVLLGIHRALHLRQHALLARLDEVETLHPE